MKFKQLEWVSDFLFMFVFMIAGNSLFRLHAVSQPVLGIVAVSTGVAGLLGLFNYLRKNEH